MQRDPERVRRRCAGSGATSRLTKATPRLAATTSQWRSTIPAPGRALCADKNRSSPSRAGAISLSSSALAEDGGEAGRQEDADPLAEEDVEALCEVENHLSARLRAPVSMKLRCRAETADLNASSYWLSLRRGRHSRNNTPAEGASSGTATPRPTGTYLTGNRLARAQAGSIEPLGTRVRGIAP